MQLDLWYSLGWRDCANPDCAREHGPWPQREFMGDPKRLLCSVCLIEAKPEERHKVVDRLRYSPERKAQMDRANDRRSSRLSEQEKQRLRVKRQEYDRNRYRQRTA